MGGWDERIVGVAFIVDYGSGSPCGVAKKPLYRVTWACRQRFD
jgi:hypothetical protein